MPREEHLPFSTVETLYDQLEQLAAADLEEEPLDEFACTLLGCIIAARLMHVYTDGGDGAIVGTMVPAIIHIFGCRNKWRIPEYYCFITDNRNFPHLHTLVLEEDIAEVALLTDGLQMLALNMDTGACTNSTPIC